VPQKSGRQKQLFTDIMIINGDTFLDFLKMTLIINFQDTIFSWIRHHHALQVKEGIREYFDKHKDTLIPRYTFQLHHHRVYGNGGGMEHGQERPAGAKILSILFRF